MQKNFILIILPMLLLVCDKPEEKSDNLLVAASIPPLADFVRNVGGDRVDVYTIVPAGVNPHAFELTPGVMKKLTAADLLVLNGVGLEFWLEEVIDVLADKKAIFMAAGLPVLQDDVHHHAEGNPHLWLDPQNAIHQVKKIYDALAEVDPANSSYYASNTALYVRHLEVLDQDIQQMVDTWPLKKFVCFHPAWEYFARR
ncbi:zinc ABC transporter substrate-binding protein, partial [candidate division KSB1 bacterium]